MFPSISAIEIYNNKIEEETESDYFLFKPTEVRQCHKVDKVRLGWDKMVVSAMSIAAAVNPYESDLPIGTVIPAVDAVDWSIGNRNCDIRPRLVDKSSGRARLLRQWVSDLNNL